MIKKCYYLIAAVVILIAAGCRTTPSHVLSASTTSLIFENAGVDSLDFEVSSDIVWTISGQHKYDWINVSPVQGKGKGIVVTVSVKANPGNIDRNGELTITATDVPAITVGIRQYAAKSISQKAIAGVTPPAADATPVSVITATDQYSGTVTWEPNDVKFTAGILYTATITLKPEAGFTFNGVPENFFTVSGATPPVTNAADGNVIKAVFPPIADGSINYPFLVNNENDLQKVGKGNNGWGLNKHYRQTANINMAGVTGWVPIGNAKTNFTGSYDGGGYTVSNLNIYTLTETEQGIFGYINATGIVRNMAVKNVIYNSAKENVGGIAGINFGTIENCYVTGEISGKSNIGGVSGINFGSVKNCYTTCNVNCNDTDIGGIVGTNGGTTEYCYTTGQVLTASAGGGIVGSNANLTSHCVALNSRVATSYNDENRVGRISGYNHGNLSSNYASVNMTITANGVNVTVTPNTSETHGGNILPNFYNGSDSGTWWNVTMGFSSDNWDFAANRLPYLKTTTKEAFKEGQGN